MKQQDLGENVHRLLCVHTVYVVRISFLLLREALLVSWPSLDVQASRFVSSGRLVSHAERVVVFNNQDIYFTFCHS